MAFPALRPSSFRHLTALLRHPVVVLTVSVTAWFVLLATLNNMMLAIQSGGLSRRPVAYYDSFEAACQAERETANCSEGLGLRDGSRYWHSEAEFAQDELVDLSGVVLIVYFTTNTYTSASKIVALYSGVFSEVVFCGYSVTGDERFWPTSSEIRQEAKLFAVPNTTRFVTYSHNPYMCFVDAVEPLDPSQYQGALLISEDVLLNVWTWPLMSPYLDKAWVVTNQPDRATFDIDSGYFCQRGQDDSVNCTVDVWPPPGWRLFSRYKTAFSRFYHKVEQLAASSRVADDFWQMALGNLTQATGGERRMFRDFNELQYIPQQYLPGVARILKMCNE